MEFSAFGYGGCEFGFLGGSELKETSIAETDIDAVAKGIRRLGPDVHGYGTVDSAWSRSTALLVIDCVLSLNRKYDGFVVPRLDAFVEKHPNINTVSELANLLDSYPSPHAFMQQELNFNYEDRANTLQSVVNFVCKIVDETPNVPEEVTLKEWAINVNPQEYQGLNIKGFGIASFQYLRMLFGADTTKPDVHIIRFVSNLIDRNVSAFEALDILEASSSQLGLSVRDVDTYIWDMSARPQQNNFDINLVRLDPDVAVAFPNDKAVNEALRFVLKVMTDSKQLTIHQDL